MKTKSFILLAVCYLIANTLVKAQAYIPFAKEGKIWTEVWEDGDYPIWHGIDTYVMKGDTLFNTKLYKKVHATTHNGNFIKYIYEDTTNKRVYFYDTTQQKDSLIYDFNLQVGDSFYLSIGSFCNAKVIDKTVEYFAASNRLKITFNLYGSFPIWYEGIGSMYGIFQPLCIVTGGENHTLLCYLEDSVLLYHNANQIGLYYYDTCFGSTQIKELQPEKLFNSYFYNHILYVKCNKPVSYALSIYDIFGRKTKEINANGDLELDLSGLRNGLYIYRIESRDSYYSSKLILNQ